MLIFAMHHGRGSPLSTGAAFYPTSIPNQAAFWDTRVYQSIELNPTMLASGSSPPAVTISGLPTRIVAPRIQIESGAATFKWTYNNIGTGALGGTFQQTGVPIPAGGPGYLLPGTGLTVSFDIGSYSSDNVYEGTVKNFRSRVAAADFFAQPTLAKQPRYLIDATTGFPYLKFDGVDDTMFCATIDRPAPLVIPSWFYGICRIDTRTSFDTVFCDSTSLSYKLALGALTGNANEMSGTNGLGVAIGSPTTAAITLSAFRAFEVGFRASAAGHSGADPTAWGDYLQWGAVATSSSVSMGNIDPSAGLCLGSRNEAAGTFCNMSLVALGIGNEFPAKANRDLLQAFWPAYWAASVVT